VDAWRSAGARARDAADALMDGWEQPFAGRIARDLAATVPSGSALCAGSSLPIRHLDAFMAPRDGLDVIANRGASGIDGFVSTAFGVAAVTTPVFALLGDLTFLHDAGGLIWNARRMPPVTFVVINDDGGGIFTFLPQAALPEHRDLFTTPHGIDFAALAGAAGCTHRRIDKASDLPEALTASERTRIIEVVVDREETLAKLREVAAGVRDALA
jgi:2-succinyl-5-enolpyruvyl-6-hydroxy-3-cyclohexene-1-carboxylate synthase